MERETLTGISILVVGGGISGLSFAIEAYRKGHNVQILERRPEGVSDGESILITASALRTPNKWPGFVERALKVAGDAIATMKKYDGTFIGTFVIGDPENPSLAIYRSKLHQTLFEFARDIGIPFTFSEGVSDYFETEISGGVILSDGRRLEADMVVAADGVGSKSWALVTGRKDPPISSGFVLYRVSFPVGPALANPIIAKELGDGANYAAMYAGPGAHIVINKIGDEICWLLTCREDGSDAEESWVKFTSSAKPLKAVEGWEPFVTELIKATPENTVSDWKLMWRDPQPKWASPNGHVIQIGDAAHPFLPTSASGATMAMEDAFSLATCLKIAGKDRLGLATKVHNQLRFERVSCAQKVGFKNRELYHKTDWDAVAKNPKLMGKMVGDWVTCHDPEIYASENFEDCLASLLRQKAFVNTNAVPGYQYEPWTVAQLMAASDSGNPIIDVGEWF